jgi:hypothetical protein
MRHGCLRHRQARRLHRLWPDISAQADAEGALILKSVPSVRVEDITIPDAPEADEASIRFFVHPPSDLEGMRAEVEAGLFKAYTVTGLNLNPQTQALPP